MNRPKIGENVQYFMRGLVVTPPCAATVVKLNANTSWAMPVVSLQVMLPGGGVIFKNCVRHWRDPAIKDNPPWLADEGCYRAMAECADEPVQFPEPGSEKPTTATVQAANPDAPRRGRPPGSKNRSEMEVAESLIP